MPLQEPVATVMGPKSPIPVSVRGLRTGPLVVGFLMLTVVLMSATAVQADELKSQATVRNALPQILEWEVLFTERPGIFVYDVTARDGNGIEDIDHLAFFFIGEESGRVYGYHQDHNPTFSGRRSATFEGVAYTDPHPSERTYRVELHVVDAINGRTIVTEAVHIGPTDKVDDVLAQAFGTGARYPNSPVDEPNQNPAPSLIPLAFGAQVVELPFAVLAIALVGTIILGTAGTAYGVLRKQTRKRTQR